MYPDYKEERVARAARRSRKAAGSACARRKSLIFKVPDGKDAERRDPDPRHRRRPAGALRAEGGAVPGDRIVGIMTPGEGITIYPIQSPALKAFEDTPERWLDVRWDIDEESPQRFPARIKVHSVNEPGTLAQIAQVIAEHDGNIDNVRMTRGSPDFTEMLIDLEVYDLKHLNAIIAQLQGEGRGGARSSG